MRNQVAEQLHDIATFSFPTIFRGIGVTVTIYGDAGRYNVLIDNKHFALVEFDSDFRYWYVSEGELNDPDLIKEIGERIEAKLY